MFERLKELSNREILKHIMWINDYQLMLVPGMLRDRLVQLSHDRLDALAREQGVDLEDLNEDDEVVQQIKAIASVRIAYFHHIPFPITSALKDIPRKEWVEILTSLNKADQIGFHTDEFANNFIQAAKHFLQLDESQSSKLTQKTVAVPIGIDGASFANNTTDLEGAPFFQQHLHHSYHHYFSSTSEDEKLSEHEFVFLKEVYAWKQQNPEGILVSAVDRMDPSKGYLQRLCMFEKLLSKLSKTEAGLSRIRNLCFAMIAPDSRNDVEEYKRNRDLVLLSIDRINKKFYGLAGNRNIIMVFNRNAQRQTVRALYSITDIHVATSYADGFHLGPEEYLLSLIKHNEDAVDDDLLSMSLEDYRQNLQAGYANPRKTNTGVCVMSNNIGIAHTKLGNLALTYEADDFGDTSETVGEDGAAQLLKAITLVEDNKHTEPLSDTPYEMSVLQRTQAMQQFVLEHDMTYWAERNIFGLDISQIKESLLVTLRDIIHRGLQYLADGEDRDVIRVGECSSKAHLSLESDDSSPETPKHSPKQGKPVVLTQSDGEAVIKILKKAETEGVPSEKLVRKFRAFSLALFEKKSPKDSPLPNPNHQQATQRVDAEATKALEEIFDRFSSPGIQSTPWSSGLFFSRRRATRSASPSLNPKEEAIRLNTPMVQARR